MNIKVFPVVLLTFSAHAFDLSVTAETDSDRATSVKTWVRTNSGMGAGLSSTVNEVSPFVSYNDYGVYLNKAPFLFFDKEFQVTPQTVLGLVLDSLDYRHTDDYDKALWFFGFSVSTDYLINEKNTLALSTTVSRVSDQNWRATSRVNYTYEFSEGWYTLIRYKNFVNSSPSDYYYSPNGYNSIQTGLMLSKKIGDSKVKFGTTFGPFSSSDQSGITAEVFSTVAFDKWKVNAVYKHEEDYQYGMINIKIDF